MSSPRPDPSAWLTPQWPAPACVRALSTLRSGGTSAAPYASLNLGTHVGDSLQAVAANRGWLRAAAGLPAEPSWLDQVHGAHVAHLDTLAPAGPADAAVTRSVGRVCAVLTADCMPVLFAAVSGAAVAAAHAGWRGLADGVLEATVAALGVAPADLLVWLGPAIGPRHFEVGGEVRDRLLASDPGAEAAFERNDRGRFLADLAALARSRLVRAGVERIFESKACTFAAAGDFFSHRRDGTTGRQATLIWLE
ncbi:MAG: peptidoglycan editing factor PgeF [Steroidobacteraceae bacterium]